MHTHVHICGCACATVFIWSSEDSFQLLVCSFHSVSQVPYSVYQTWMTSTSSCWPISRVMEWNLTMVFWLILTWSLICCPSKQLFLVVFAHHSDLMIMNLCTLCYGKFSLCIIVMSRFTGHSKSILTIIVFNNMWYVIPCPLGFLVFYYNVCYSFGGLPLHVTWCSSPKFSVFFLSSPGLGF